MLNFNNLFSSINKDLLVFFSAFILSFSLIFIILEKSKVFKVSIKNYSEKRIIILISLSFSLIFSSAIYIIKPLFIFISRTILFFLIIFSIQVILAFMNIKLDKINKLYLFPSIIVILTIVFIFTFDIKIDNPTLYNFFKKPIFYYYLILLSFSIFIVYRLNKKKHNTHNNNKDENKEHSKYKEKSDEESPIKKEKIDNDIEKFVLEPNKIELSKDKKKLI